MLDRTEQQIEVVQRSFVAIRVLDTMLGTVNVFSSFWVCIGGQNYLFTAGHILDSHVNKDGVKIKGLRELVSSGDAEIRLIPWHATNQTDEVNFALDRCLTTKDLLDHFMSNQCELTAGEKGKWLEYVSSVTTDGEDSDIGVISVGALVSENLERVGAAPLTIENFQNPTEELLEHNVNPKGEIRFVLFGLPEQSRKGPLGMPVEIGFVMMDLRIEDVQKHFTFWNPNWNTNLHAPDIKGCSGGPVVAIGLSRPFVLGLVNAQFRGPRLRINCVQVKGLIDALAASGSLPVIP